MKSKLIRRLQMGVVACTGIVAQTTGCNFDSQAFLSDSVTAVLTNASTVFVLTSLSEWLKVTPSFPAF